MINQSDLLKCWQKKYDIVPQQSEKVRQVKSAISAFNTNIDAVVKISGAAIEKLIEKTGFSSTDLKDNHNKILSPKDVVRGLIKCFSAGIAEEWLIADKVTYDWIKENIKYERLQMGGQGGIIGNLLAVLGVQKVMVHTGSHSLLQARQFLDLPNLFGLDAQGNEKIAAHIVREKDEPQIHWIIEFDKSDSFRLENQKISCPKSNRFIATYDKINLNLQIMPEFLSYMEYAKYDYLLLSGFHNLTSENHGEKHIRESAELIKKWKQNNPRGIIHLEIASTQDKVIRKALWKKLAPLVDSVGLNEREALEALEIFNYEKFQQAEKQKLSAVVLLKIIDELQQKTKVARIQLHMFGLYMVLQNKFSFLSAEENLRGMLLASAVAATKAHNGKINDCPDFSKVYKNNEGKIYLTEFSDLAAYLNDNNFAFSGVADYQGKHLAAVPTILIENPLTLVGMGDTISSSSLLGAF